MTQPAPLPAAFISRIRAQLGPEAEDYLAAMARPYVRGLRRNPRKPAPCNGTDGIGSLLSPIPWEPNGFYLAVDSPAGSLPVHEAGAYYLQEPSAMLPARVLAPAPGERVLDLCAAPGGKSTQLADMLNGEGLLVCNEPIFSRAQILSRNLERMGVSNALVSCADPAQLADAWPCAFDAILVDAPCSGEGMFRRHPEARVEWSESAPAGCAARQLRILESAFTMLRPGGRLVYSTCTLNTEENEGVIEAFLQKHGELSTVNFSVPMGKGAYALSQNGMFRALPHQLEGEGHFLALLAKDSCTANAAKTAFAPAESRLATASGPLLQAYNEFCQNRPFPCPNAVFGDTLIHAPDLPPLRGIKILRAGLQLGMLKGKVFAPDHALALALSAPYPLEAIPLNATQARAYHAGEVLLVDTQWHGYALVTYGGFALGFVKSSNGQLKNHYPKGLRRP